jgi:hypothetical protein
MPCPDPTLGAVTGQSGFYTGFADAVLIDRTLPDWQWQWPVLLTGTAGLCARRRTGGTWQPNEVRLAVTVLGYHSHPGTTTTDLTNATPVPYPPAPATLTPHVAVELPAGSGNAYTVAGVYQGASGSQKDATDGSVRYTAMGDGLAEVVYDLTFGKLGRVQGTFSAPYCEMC